MTWLWPGHVQPDRARATGPRRPHASGRGRAQQSSRWWDQATPRTSTGGGYAQGPGYGKFFVHSPRNQRVLTKATVAKNRGPALAWYKHGAYLQREGAQQEGHGRGFAAQGNPVTLSTTLAAWQRAGDPHVFKVMLSPEHGDRLNLQEFTRAVMRAVERDLGHPVEWAGIDHYNNGHPHVHLCLRGVRDGQTVTIAKSYLHEGIKARAQEVATRLLGVRLAHEIDLAAQRSVSWSRWSGLDRSIHHKLSPQRTISDGQLTRREQERLSALTQRGLAWPITGGWQLSARWEDLKMQPDAFRKKPHEQEAEHDTQRPKAGQDPRRETDRDHDEQRRRTVLIDDVEHDLGWER